LTASTPRTIAPASIPSLSEAAASPLNWRASALPASEDEFGGSPGRAGGPEECPPPVPVRPPVLISEIMYHPAGSSYKEEYIEIYNPQGDCVDISHIKLLYKDEEKMTLSGEIPKKGFYLLVRSLDPMENGGIESVDEKLSFGLVDAGAKLELRDEAGEIIDTVEYGADDPWPGDTKGYAIELSQLDPPLDNGDGANWHRATEKYPFNPNGSPDGFAGLCSSDGRHLATMPHPERAFLPWQCHWLPEEMKKLQVSPWMQMFRNAYDWCMK